MLFERYFILIHSVINYPAGNKCKFVVVISDLLIPETKLYTGKYSVYNPKCRIPELEVWSLQILSIIEHSDIVNPRCALSSTVTINGTIKGLSFVKKELLAINKSALAPLGLNIKEAYLLAMISSKKHFVWLCN